VDKTGGTTNPDREWVDKLECSPKKRWPAVKSQEDKACSVVDPNRWETRVWNKLKSFVNQDKVFDVKFHIHHVG
jgi:hypothetical protein